MRITDGAGVNVAYDSVGAATFAKSVDCLARFGHMVLYGNASGPVTQFNPATLGPKGSLFLTAPPCLITWHLVKTLSGAAATSSHGLRMVLKLRLNISIRSRRPSAHEALKAGKQLAR